MMILSDNGFVDFDGFIDQGEKQTLKITMNDGKFIHCTLDHKLKTQTGWIMAEELFLGDVLVDESVVIDIEVGDVEPVYDALNVGCSHAYYTNGFISHNCSFLYIDECVGGDTKITVDGVDTEIGDFFDGL